MKHLLLVFLFSGSLDGFSQDTLYLWPDGKYSILNPGSPLSTPDTLRATLIIYYDRGPAILHTKPGFVVLRGGKEDVYLDDRKKEIKAPLEVWSYKIKK